MDKFDYLNAGDISWFDNQYKIFQENPQQLDPELRRFFEGFEFQNTFYPKKGQKTGQIFPDEFKVINLINAYRERGHFFTQTNPVRTRRKYSPTLDIENFGLSTSDLQKKFEAGKEIGIGTATLETIIQHLKQTYTGSIGVEYRYIRHTHMVDWLREKMETSLNTPIFNAEKKKTILSHLLKAVYFEQFLHRRFVGQKRFSLEGCESLIPALKAIVNKGAELGVEEFVIGMAHRGRLNVLGNVLQKPFQDIFAEFEGKEYEDEFFLGDVKYHLGFTSVKTLNNSKKITLNLAPNPSHLEAVNPVVQGIARAHIDKHYLGDNNKLVPVLIHGDAAIAGQGVVYEVVQMSELEAYKTGGTLHLITNNQLGFTTNYLDARSGIYCTDVAKTIMAPILHVNADDVEAVVYSIELALEFREKFHKDVFIDLLGYRRYGHNESDEPRFTQPILYKIIEKHPDPYKIYKNKLIAEGIISEEECLIKEKEFTAQLEEFLDQSYEMEKATVTSFMEETWRQLKKAEPVDFEQSVATVITTEKIQALAEKICAIPSGKPLFKKLEKLQLERLQMIVSKKQVDWALAELLAYASLADEGNAVRMSGQDVERGTFSHRHAVLKIQDSEEEFVPLQHIGQQQASVEIYNSLLSEYAVLGFEYGYALAAPNSLVIWEAQFGDFANGAQIIIDQFISSGEEKWNVFNHLVMLLPHGYEGQGPEHSSARMERFLVLAADYNMQIVNCSTPANFFHALRRQIKQPFRKPLVVFTPKSLLRHPGCISPVSDISNGYFMEVIDDFQAKPDDITKVVFCTGKIFYELIAEKLKRQQTNIAIIRIEQIFPLPKTQIENILQKYHNATEWLWVQEEPGNMGAWPFLMRNFGLKPLRVICRPDSGSPATGSAPLHIRQQKKIIEKTFEDCSCERIKDECRMTCMPKEYSVVKHNN